MTLLRRITKFKNHQNISHMKTFTLLFLLIIYFNSSHAHYVHDSIKVENGYLHYYTKGKGHPVVLLQGNPGSSSYYVRMIADSLDDYLSILVDYQGTGRSQQRKIDSSRTTIDNIVQDYEMVRKKLGIQKWTMIGHSYGAQHALYYATKYPSRVEKVISIGGVTTDNKLMRYFYDNNYAYQSDQGREDFKKLLVDQTIDPVKKSRLIVEHGARSAFFDKKKAAKFVEFFPDDEWQIVFNEAFQQLWKIRDLSYEFDFSKALYALDIPVRTIQGRQDPVGEGVPVLLNERMKDSKLYFIERTGHFPWIEQPSIFFKNLGEFLKN